MSIPHRSWDPTPFACSGSIGREYLFPDTMTRSDDELTIREHFKEILEPVLLRLGRADLEGAIRAVERLCRAKPHILLLHVEYARLLLATGSLDAATGLLNGILREHPKNLEALKLLGHATLQQGDLPQAMAIFARAAHQMPSDSFAQINCHALRSRLRHRTLPKPDTTAMRPVVATSIPPNGLEMSQRAVNSWLERGFTVLSVNTAAERDLLAPHFPNVEFCLCEDTAKEQFGKDYQYLDSLLDALAYSGAPLCSIINADIVLRGKDAVWDQFCAAANERFVYASRVNVARLHDQTGTLLEQGYDLFMFPSSFLKRIPRTGLIMGQPAWDVFLPTWITRCGLPTSYCFSPVALHEEHPMQWSRTANTRMLTMAFSWFAPELATLVSEDTGCSAYLRAFTTGISQTMNKISRNTAQPLFCRTPEMDTCFALVDPLYWLRDCEETLLSMFQ